MFKSNQISEGFNPTYSKKRKRLHDKICAYCGHKWICHYKFDCRAPNAECGCQGFVRLDGDTLS